MRRFAIALLAVRWLAAQTLAPPAIDAGGILNAASRMPASLAGGAIARGARFVLSGVRLGPATAVRAAESDPPEDLGGVRVDIAQGESHVAARLFSVAAERIEGWIPDSAPLGDVAVTVAYRGLISEPRKLNLVRSSFGFETPPEATEATRGQTITLVGTGAGGAPLEVFVGGKAAGSTRATAASCCKGREEVRFQIPADAPLGCAVPVQAVSDGRPSNTVDIAIHEPGRGCIDRVDWFRRTVPRTGSVVLLKAAFHLRLFVDYTFDYALAGFARDDSGRRSFPSLPAEGTCSLVTGSLQIRHVLTQARTPAEWTSMMSNAPAAHPLDAGTTVQVTGPGARSKSLPRDMRQPQFYDAVLGGLPPYSRMQAAPIFLNRGTYTLSAAGGADVGPFQVRLKVPRPLIWNNRDALNVVERAAGTTVEWQAADPGHSVLIAAASADHFTGDSALCLCLAKAGDRRFTIPAISLLNLPPTGEENGDLSYLVLAEIPTEPKQIRVRGLDAAFAAFVSASARLVEYK